jgi:hypothetical protein
MLCVVFLALLVAWYVQDAPRSRVNQELSTCIDEQSCSLQRCNSRYLATESMISTDHQRRTSSMWSTHGHHQCTGRATTNRQCRVYTKPKGKLPDFDDPVVLPRRRCTVEDFCNKIHKQIMKSFKHALVWGVSSKHRPQRVGKDHVLCDQDIMQIVKKI